MAGGRASPRLPLSARPARPGLSSVFPSAPCFLPPALIPLLGSQRAGPLQAGGDGQAPVDIGTPLLVDGRQLRVRAEALAGPRPHSTPQEAAERRAPLAPLGRLSACCPPPWWAGGQDLRRGRGGPPLGHGVWEGGIYRLLFTKPRPRKTFNGSQLKGDSYMVQPLPHMTRSGPPPSSRLPGPVLGLGGLLHTCPTETRPAGLSPRPHRSGAAGGQAGWPWAPGTGTRAGGCSALLRASVFPERVGPGTRSTSGRSLWGGGTP